MWRTDQGVELTADLEVVVHRDTPDNQRLASLLRADLRGPSFDRALAPPPGRVAVARDDLRGLTYWLMQKCALVGQGLTEAPDVDMYPDQPHGRGRGRVY